MALILLLAALSPTACRGNSIIESLELDVLNISVNSRVHVNTPFELPCFSSYEGKHVDPDAAACQAVQESYASPTFRIQYPGAS